MRSLARGMLALHFTLLPLDLPSAQTISDLSLSDVLLQAMRRAESGVALSEPPRYQSSSWLAGLPSLSVSYLQSNERDGVDETQLSLHLPIKSGQRRRADAALSGLSGELGELATQHRALYFSGLIREALWSHRIADTRRRAAAQKRQVLLTLEQRQRDLLAANASSAYSLLLLQKELVDVEISQQDFLQQARQWLQQYQQVTGLGSVPAHLDESPLDSDAFPAHRHPRVRALELARQQQLALLSAGSQQASEWNLSLQAKNLDSPGFEEDQYGLALEVPLSFVRLESEANNSELQAVNREYSLAREQLVQQLHRRWLFLSGQAEILQEKQQLLARASTLTQQIAGQLQELAATNEIAQEIALRRLMEDVDTRTEAQVNALLMQQNNAMLRQAAGLPL